MIKEGRIALDTNGFGVAVLCPALNNLLCSVNSRQIPKNRALLRILALK
jgi:hypothetical protein